MFNRRRDILEMLYPLKNIIKLRVVCPKDWQGKIIHKDGITYLHDTLDPEEMGKYLAGAKINLCINRNYEPSNDTKIASTTPGRVFQETACRRMVIVDRSRPELFDYFEDGKEIITFDENNQQELTDKIMYYLTHEQEREAIAHNGYTRTMAENTWYCRIKKLLEICSKN
jgi:spore maturation protein CgeB